MTAATVDELVSDYLSRLEAATSDLPEGRRAELLHEIREHIETARSEGVAADEATTRTMLDQLGDPEEIAAAARAELDEAPTGSGPPGTVETKPGTGLELAAVLLLTIGSFIPIVGWAIGVVLLWASRRWTVIEKLVGTLVVPTGPAGLLFFGGIGFFLLPAGDNDCVSWSDSAGNSGSTCDETGSGIVEWIGGLAFLALLIAPFVVAGVLYSRARTRADAEPPVHRPVAAQRTWTGTEVTAVVLLAAAPVLALILAGTLGTPIVTPLALLAGLAFVWASTQWTQREKWIGTGIAVAPILAAVLVLLTLRSL